MTGKMSGNSNRYLARVCASTTCKLNFLDDKMKFYIISQHALVAVYSRKIAYASVSIDSPLHRTVPQASASLCTSCTGTSATVPCSHPRPLTPPPAKRIVVPRASLYDCSFKHFARGHAPQSPLDRCLSHVSVSTQCLASLKQTLGRHSSHFKIFRNPCPWQQRSIYCIIRSVQHKPACRLGAPRHYTHKDNQRTSTLSRLVA